MKGFVCGIISVACGAVGAFVGYRVAKDRYLKQADEEIASVKEYAKKTIAKAMEEADTAKDDAKRAKESSDTYRQALEKLSAENYIRDAKRGKKKEDKEPEDDSEDD